MQNTVTVNPLLRPGDHVGRYRVEAFLGQGAFGQVYHVTQLGLNAPRAVKLLRRDMPGVGSSDYNDCRQRFQLEAQLGAQLDHPHIVRVHDVEQVDDALLLVMEYVPNGSLADRLKAQGPLPVGDALRMARELAEGLAALHALDAVHRDLKPSNILFDAQGHAKVADLGLAQIPHGPSARSQQSAPLPHPGTPAYMSPEQRDTREHLTPASDIYALGAVLFEALTGRVYKSQRPGTDVRALCPDVPASTAALLAQMLAKDPEVRPWGGAEAVPLLQTEEAVYQQWVAEQTARQQQEAAEAARRQREVEETVRKQREAEEAARQQREAEVAARRQREAEEAARKQREAEETARKQREAEAAARQQREATKATPPPRSPKKAAPIPIWPWVIGAVLVAALLLGGGELLRRLTTSSSVTPTPASNATAPIPTAMPPLAAQLGDTWTRPADGMVMVYVPAAQFQMGSTAEQVRDSVDVCIVEGLSESYCRHFADEQPAHTVALDAFWIDRTEVTNVQYRKCVAAGACTASSYNDYDAYNSDAQPVVGVSWHDAAAYCAWTGGQLPTEAQWEYAARGPEGRVYPWGNEWREKVANYDEGGYKDGYNKSAPVGSFPDGVSWVGALDMAGNAWEWVADWYGAYTDEVQRNPIGPMSGNNKVLRGGAFALDPNFLRTTYRYGDGPNASAGGIGFRCAGLSSDR